MRSGIQFCWQSITWCSPRSEDGRASGLRPRAQIGALLLYDFKQLSPADFEDLTRDLLQQHWSVRLESFRTGRDRGIDLRHAVVRTTPALPTLPARAVPGRSTIVQCKHFAGSTVAALVRQLRNQELPKIARLAPKRYVLVTSLPLNPDDKEKLQDAVHPHLPTPEDIFGAEDMNNLLGLHPDIETQHFKLWLSSTAVLERVLHNAERVQTEFDVDRVRRAIPLYVQTSNYTRAMKILDEHRFVIISGVPGIGKTTLADMLLFAHLENGFQPVVIKSDIAAGRGQFRGEQRQIFYFDDFLGGTFLGNRYDFLGNKEDSAILDLMAIIGRSKHSRLILTTREHILQHAFQIPEHFRRQKGGLADHRCILELSDYTLLDRGRILYNHIYFSDLPDAFKARLLAGGFYMEILKHRNFNPRLVEWLSRFVNVKAVPANAYRKEVERVLENPEQLWRIAFEQQISEAREASSSRCIHWAAAPISISSKRPGRCFTRSGRRSTTGKRLRRTGGVHSKTSKAAFCCSRTGTPRLSIHRSKISWTRLLLMIRNTWKT